MTGSMPGAVPRPTVPRLHVLTSDAVIARPDFVATASDLLRAMGPRGALHLRTRVLSGRDMFALTTHLLEVSRSAHATLVINERVDVALAAGADAVQLGRGALQVDDVSRMLSRGMRIGMSVHTPAEARAAEDAARSRGDSTGRLDWLMVGHIFATESHPNDPGRGVELVHAVRKVTTIPVIAVGGITPDRVPALRAAGASGVAAIAGIWDERSPKDAAIHYLTVVW